MCQMRHIGQSNSSYFTNYIHYIHDSETEPADAHMDQQFESPLRHPNSGKNFFS